MKQSDINKLYDKMNVQDRAKMTFEALCIGDKATANNICDSVPHYDYRLIDIDYKTPLSNYFLVGHIWAAEYWKLQAKMLAAIGLQLSDSLNNDVSVTVERNTKIDKLDQLHYFWESRLVALGLILKALKKSHGLDILAIPNLADAQTIYGLELEVEHLGDDALEYYEMYLAQFISFIDGKKTTPEVDAYFL